MQIGFLNVFPDQTGGYPGTNFGNQCGDAVFKNRDGSDSQLLSHCPYIGPDIKYCQDKGKTVLLSLGGAVPDNSHITSHQSAVDFADFLWAAFGPMDESSEVPRPFGDACVDGFDFDIESVLQPGLNENDLHKGYGTMVNTLRSHFASDESKTYYISGAPQCIVPDSHLSHAIETSWFDFLFVQFYNTPQCSARSFFDHHHGGDNTDISFDDWVDYVQRRSLNKNAKVFLGLPGSKKACNDENEYLSLSEASEIIEHFQCKHQEQFGGVMIYDAAYSDENRDNHGRSYGGHCKMELEKNDRDECGNREHGDHRTGHHGQHHTKHHSKHHSATGTSPFSGLFPSGVYPTGAFPTGMFPTGVFPSDGGYPTGVLQTRSGIFPSGVIPSGSFSTSVVVPSGIFPTGVIPSGIFPTGVVPSGVFSTGVVVPSGVFPTGVIPSGVSPSGSSNPSFISTGTAPIITSTGTNPFPINSATSSGVSSGSSMPIVVLSSSMPYPLTNNSRPSTYSQSQTSLNHHHPPSSSGQENSLSTTAEHNSATTTSAEYVASVIYETDVETITSCAPGVTNCPARSQPITTVVPVSTITEGLQASLTTQEVVVTEIVTQHVTTCPVAHTITSAGHVTVQTEIITSTVTETITSTICTKCVAPVKTAAPAQGLQTPTHGQSGSSHGQAPAQGSNSSPGSSNPGHAAPGSSSPGSESPAQGSSSNPSSSNPGHAAPSSGSSGSESTAQNMPGAMSHGSKGVESSPGSLLESYSAASGASSPSQAAAASVAASGQNQPSPAEASANIISSTINSIPVETLTIVPVPKFPYQTAQASAPFAADNGTSPSGTASPSPSGTGAVQSVQAFMGTAPKTSAGLFGLAALIVSVVALL